MGEGGEGGSARAIYRNPSRLPPQRGTTVPTKSRRDHVARIRLLAETFRSPGFQRQGAAVDEKVGAEHAAADFLAVGAVAECLWDQNIMSQPVPCPGYRYTSMVCLVFVVVVP